MTASKPPAGLSVLPVAPDAGEGDLPVEKVFALGDAVGGVPELGEGGPEGALADGVGRVDAFGAVGQEREGLLMAEGDCADERLFEDGAGLLFHGSAEPVHAAKGVEKCAQRGGRFLDLGEEIGRFFDFGNVGVGQFFDALHALGGVFGGLDGAAGGEAAETGEFAGGVVDAQADERVAAAQVVVEEGEGRANGEAVQPEGDFGKLDGERVLVDAVDAALEDHAADDGLVGELGFVDDPVRKRGRASRMSSRMAAMRSSSGEL